MAKLKVAEIFYSIQGEGLWVGVPSVFLRTFGCNFSCRGFGMPKGKLSTEPDDIASEFLPLNPDVKYNELPLALTGCDSYASWHPKFKSLSPVMDVEKVVVEIELSRLDSCDGIKPFATGSIHLVITGGEPLLGWQRAYPELLDKVFALGYRHITFETNGTQEISDEFADYMLRNQIINGGMEGSITFSVSPKLGCSGESREDALRPEIVESYQRFGTVYLKFVIANFEDMLDVVYFVNAYREAGWKGEVYLMPCGGDTDLYNMNAPEVADLAMKFGYRYSPRLQVDLYDNAWGT